MENPKIAVGSSWIVLGATSFSNHPILGKIAVVFGLFLMLYTLFSKFLKSAKN